MTSGRIDPPATLLRGGQVLVSGSESSRTGPSLSSWGEVYNSATANWELTSALNIQRQGHTATLLPDGKVLVAGGLNSTRYTNQVYEVTAELYDPKTRTWSVTGDLSVARQYHTAALLGTGKVLVAGGFNNVSGFLVSAELYGPATGTWSPTAPLASSQRFHRATLLANGKVLATGGQSVRDAVDSAELYDPATETWSAAGAVKCGHHHTATLLWSLPGDPYLLNAELYGPPLSTYTVTTTADSDHGSCDATDCTLREAINAANAGVDDSAIKFAPGVAGIIDLNAALPVLSRNIAIIGPGSNVLTVQRKFGGNYRIFTISNATSTGPVVTVSGLTLNNGFVTGNTVQSNSAGGSIYNDHGTLRITKCAITNNHAATGSGVYNFSGTVGVSDSTVSDNDASATLGDGGTTWGGGAFVNFAAQGSASLTLSNTTITGNSADRGTAIHNSGATGSATVALQNCTVSFNAGVQTGGDIYNDGSSANINLQNTILRGAGPFAPTMVNANGATVTSQGNNISNDAAGGDNSTAPGGWLNHPGDIRNTDPRLASLAENGGPTRTAALLPDSPAINAGNDSLAPSRDQRGYGRAGASDIGAFEFGGTPPPVLANMSTRLRVETGDNVLIGGFIITGSQQKKVILRAIGPSLSFADKLADPMLELHDSSGALLETNDNWVDSPNKQAIIDSTIPPTNNLESAIVRSVAPGNYTAVMRGVNNGTGIGVVEAYDLDPSADSELANISTRGFVQTGDNVLIAGTIVVGQTSQKVIVRGIGPSLSVPGKMADPTLELHDGNGTLLEGNDNWQDSPNKQAIIDSTIPPSDPLESAIVRTLTPGNYTAILRGVNNTTGIAVVEVYALN